MSGRQQSAKSNAQAATRANRHSRTNMFESANNKLTLIDQRIQPQQQVQSSIQIMPGASSMQAQLPLFNYNPLYMGLQHQFNDQTGVVEDKNMDGLSQHINGTDDILGNEVDIMSDIYNYSDSTENSCHKQHCVSVQTFGQPNEIIPPGEQSQMSANYRGQQPHQQPTSFIQPCSRKQEVQFTGSPKVASERLPSNSNSCRQQQQSFQQSSQYDNNNNAQTSQNLMSSCANQRQRKKFEQEQGRNGKLSAQTNFSHQQHSHGCDSGFHQQHQFTIENGNSSSSQVELSEECTGLFVEYQTNRSSLGGLEELNTLNVANCDSETLEDQINMLASEDCFRTSDDLQDYGVGEGADHLINMLFMSSNQSPNEIPSNQQQSTLAADDGLNQVNPSLYNITNVASAEDSGQFEKPPTSHATEGPQQQVIPRGKSTNGSYKKGSSVANNKQAANLRQVKDSCKKVNLKRKQSCVEMGQSSDMMQNKITTTNTNKRLLPKSKNSSGVQQGIANRQDSKKSSSVANTTWTNSPSSVSNTSICSTMSPSSGSQIEPPEEPYRQQLENLKKKLKMDLAPVVDGSQEVQSGRLNGASATKDSTPSYQLVKPMTISSNGLSDDIFLSQNSTQKSNGCPTYLIARSFDSNSAFETNGTIYLRTSNGLVPINSDRRSSMPIVNLCSTDSDYSSASQSSSLTSAPLNSSVIMNCVSDCRYSAGIQPVTTQGPTRVVFQTMPPEDQTSINQVPIDRVDGPQVLIPGSAQRAKNKNLSINDALVPGCHNLFNGTLFHNNERTDSQQDNCQPDSISNEVSSRRNYASSQTCLIPAIRNQQPFNEAMGLGLETNLNSVKPINSEEINVSN